MVSDLLLSSAWGFLGGLQHLGSGFLIGVVIFTLTHLHLSRRGPDIGDDPKNQPTLKVMERL